MYPAISKVLEEIMHVWRMQQVMMKEDIEFVPADDIVIPIGFDAGRFISKLIETRKFKNILEVGTSHGYSTLWMADAIKRTGGKIITIEKRKKKVEIAQSNFKRAGMDDVIEIKQGNAKDTLAKLEGIFDFVLLDARKDEYIDYFKMIEPKLSVGGIVVADNMYKPERFQKIAMKYIEYVSSLKDFKTQTHDIGSGIEVSEKIK